MKKKRFLILYLSWGIVVSVSNVLSLFITLNLNKEIVAEASRAFFTEIITTRAWNASHGGIYLIVTEKDQPNPYLEDSLRDLTTTNGIRLTKVNPAYMTRQISEIARTKHNVSYHITSLNPIRPANKADAWERKALESFEQGVPEVFELVNTDTAKLFRYMAPLRVTESCLTCHEKQGYSLGQIRGGISVTTPSNSYFATVRRQVITRSILFLSLLLIGFAGIYFFQNTVNRQFAIVAEQNSQLVRNNKEKDRLFSIVAHDLRAPLSGIHGLSEMLLEESAEMTTEDQTRIIGSIFRSSENVLKLSEHLMQWYQVRKGTLSPRPEYFRLAAIAEEVVELYDERAEKKEIAVSIKIPAGMKVYCDINMIESILRNLVNNSLKFTPTGGSIEIEANDVTNSDEVELSVKDSGIGMDKETLDGLFNEDLHSSRPGTDQEEGTGLGLTICREFVDQNKGTIRVVSAPGAGSTFILTLPKSPRS